MMMGDAMERELLAPPTTYEDWLKCFDFLKSSASIDSGTIEVITKGAFVYKGYIVVQFQQKLVETVNNMLNKRIGRLQKDLNILISFNELADIVPLFIRLRNEVRKCLFFKELAFLDESFKCELEQAVKTQMGQFWDNTVTFLQKQSYGYSNADFEDSLFLMRRIKLFAEAA